MILHGGWGSILREGGGNASVNTNKSGSPWRKVCERERGIERVKEIGERERTESDLIELVRDHKRSHSSKPKLAVEPLGHATTQLF